MEYSKLTTDQAADMLDELGVEAAAVDFSRQYHGDVIENLEAVLYWATGYRRFYQVPEFAHMFNEGESEDED